LSDGLVRPAKPAGNKLRRAWRHIVDLYELAELQMEPPDRAVMQGSSLTLVAAKYFGLLCALAWASGTAGRCYIVWFRPHANLAHAAKLAAAICIVALLCGVLVTYVAPRDTRTSFEWVLYSFIMVLVCAQSFGLPTTFLQVGRLTLAAFCAVLIAPLVGRFWRDRRAVRLCQVSVYAMVAWVLTTLALL